MADHDLPVSGSLAGNVGWELAEECLPHQPVRTLWSAEGDLAPLGRTRASGRHCVDDRGAGFNGRLVFTAADGEALWATYTFALLSQGPALLTMKMTGRFVHGGTGRFTRASGSWTAVVSAHTTVAPPTVETTWPVDLDFEGLVTCQTSDER
jgi:hypothetical protein